MGSFEASGGVETDKRALAMLAIVKEMRSLRDQLPPRPALAEIMEVQKAISEIEHRLIEKLADIAQSTRPYGVNPGWFLALQAMREDRCRRDADMEKRPHLAVIELDEFHRHYDAIIFQAENAVLDGADGPTGLSSNIRVGNDPRLISYPNSGGSNASAYVDASAGSLQLTSPARDSVSNTPRSVLSDGGMFSDRQNVQVPAKAGGLSAALHQGSGVPDLTTIEENQAIDEAPAKLLAMIEDAAMDNRDTFDISEGFGSLTWLPDTVGALDTLTTLNLSKNRLLFIPSSIGNLARLQTLDLHGNRLTSLPETIGNLQNLTLLDFHGNKIDELPVSIGGCESLVELRGDFNDLRGLPEAIGQCVALETVSLSLNKLKHLPRTLGELVSLTFLDLHYNEIEALPTSICNLTKLVTLNIAAQHFNLQQLPMHIGNLGSLTEFNMSECYIKILPDSFTNLTSLKILKLDGNPLVDPPLDVVAQGKEAVMEHIRGRAGSGRGSKSLQPRDIEFKTGFRRFWHKATGGSHPVGSAPAIVGRFKNSLGSQGSGSFLATTPDHYKTQDSVNSDIFSETSSP